MFSWRDHTANACTLRAVLDGKACAGRVVDFPPAPVRRVEVYRSAGMSAEVADSRAGCGVIAIWTDDAPAPRP